MYRHCYNVFISNERACKWVVIWAWNKEEARKMCAEKHPDMEIEKIRYIK